MAQPAGPGFDQSGQLDFSDPFPQILPHAVGDLVRVSGCGGDQTDFMLVLADHYLRAGQKDEAFACLKRSIEVSQKPPLHESLHRHLSMVAKKPPFA